MIRFNVYLPDEMHEALRVLAFKNRSSMAEEIRKAIEEKLRKEKEE